jgi:glycosyltransferase involved in cell wall biosynthesis
MEIGVVTTWFERGAAYVSRAYRDILAPRHRVWIYARGGEKYAVGDPKWDTPEVTWAPRVLRHSSSHVDWGHFETWVADRKLNAVIFNEQAAWDVVWRARHLPVLLGAYVDFYTADTVPFFALYDFLLCNTQRHFGVFRDFNQSIYIPWGTDVSLFAPQTDRAFAGPVTFFHSCGASPYRKGTDLVLAACQKLRGAYRLVLHTQSSLKEDVRKLVESLPGDCVRVIQADVGPPGLYHLGDVYVYPSRSDGIGLTVCEALAAGLPVIATDDGPMNEFVIDGQTGSLVRTQPLLQRHEGYYWPTNTCDINSLTAAMQWYIDNPSTLPSMKQAAREYAVRERNWARNAAPLPDLIETMDIARNVRRPLACGIRSLVAKERLYASMDPVAGLLNTLGAPSVNRMSNRLLTRLLG